MTTGRSVRAGRRALREALAESNFDPNPLVGALFDPDELGCGRESDTATVEAHIEALEDLVRRETHADILAAAAVLLAISLGHSPAEQ